MSSEIVNVDVDEPPPELKAGPDRGLYVIAWRNGVPEGTFPLPPGQDSSSLQKWLREISRRPQPPAPLGETGCQPRITAAICTRHRRGAVKRCLTTLEQQCYPNHETLVVDNGNEPTVRAIAESFGARYVVERRTGICFARNRALREAAGDVVAFTDDDCEPHPGWLSAIAHEFAHAPELACCTGPVLPAALETSAQELLEARGGYNRGFTRHVFTEHSEKHRYRAYPLQVWLFGTGGNMAFRRSTLQALGGFDAFMTTAEDLEIFFRVLRAGHPLVYTPWAIVHHHHVRQHRTLRNRMYKWGWGYMAFLLKVALEEPGYRRQALSEIRHWFYPFQLRERLASTASGFPPDLYLAELIGGVSGLVSCFLRHSGTRPPGQIPLREATSSSGARRDSRPFADSSGPR